MANEITYTSRFQASKGGSAVSTGTTSFTFDMTGDQVYTGNPEISSTTAAAVSTGPVNTSNRFWVRFRNQDDPPPATGTSTILISLNGSGGAYQIVLTPGASAGPLLCEASSSIYAKLEASGAALLEVVAAEV